MGALAIVAPARRLLRYALDFMRLTQPPPHRARMHRKLLMIGGWGKDFGLLILTVELNPAG